MNQREIKVKFWNGKKMSASYELLDLLYEGVPSEIADIEGGLNTNPKFLEKIVTLEFTGLKDNNGKEIWESDLVKYKDRTWMVKYYQNGFYLFEKDSACADFDSWWNETEVIGNIYENKELLK